jgi:hypothetical protein
MPALRWCGGIHGLVAEAKFAAIGLVKSRDGPQQRRLAAA